MDTTDTLEIQIAKARENLSEESKFAIDAVDWKSIILGMRDRFNEDQLENLEIETELLLCGLIDTEDYQKELELRMRLHPSDSMSLINELDKLIFKKIQEDLEKRLSGEIKVIPIKKKVVIDPRFINVPQNVGEAIALSNWKEKLYEIAQKYNLPIDKMGVLEEITIKTITGEIKTENYEKEVRSQINIPEDKTKDFITEINEVVFKRIQEIMRSGGSIKKDVKIPLPPYGVIKNEELRIKNEKTNIKRPIPPYGVIKNEDDHHLPLKGTPPQKEGEEYHEKIENQEVEKKIVTEIKKEGSVQDTINNILATKTNSSEAEMYKEHGIEIISNDQLPITNEKAKVISNNQLPITNENTVIPEKPKETNIITDKLFGNTANESTVSDYSLPKITPILDKHAFASAQTINPTNIHDPYHEAV